MKTILFERLTVRDQRRLRAGDSTSDNVIDPEPSGVGCVLYPDDNTIGNGCIKQMIPVSDISCDPIRMQMRRS